MRAIACIALTLALAGCATQDEIEVDQCAKNVDIPSWDHCIQIHNARHAARRAAEQQEESDNSAAMAVLAGTAFLNGYNQARPAMIMCQHVGMMTLCQ